MPGIEREALAGLRNDLAAARVECQKWADAVRVIEEQNAQPYAMLAQSKNLRDAMDRTLRQALLGFFYLTEDKKPVEGLSIKEVKNVTYDADKALDWVLERLVRNVIGLYSTNKTDSEIIDALRNDILFLVLDGNAIKKAAESGMFGPSAPFKVEKVAQATIATDLNKFLE